MFKDGRELDNFTRINKYNDTNKIMKPAEKESERDGGWEREWSKTFVSFIGRFGRILINQKKHRWGEKGQI